MQVKNNTEVLKKMWFQVQSQGVLKTSKELLSQVQEFHVIKMLLNYV